MRYTNITDISGNLPKEELRKSAEKPQEKLQDKVEGFINSISTEFRLRVVFSEYSESSLLVLDKSFFGKISDFVQGEDKKKWIRWESMHKRYKDSPSFSHTLAYLFPHHNLALLLNKWVFDEHPEFLTDLIDLGYVPVEKNVRRSGSDMWGNENKLEVIAALRSKEHPGLRAIDSRANEILNMLTYNLLNFNQNSKVETYSFGIFSIRGRTPKDIYALEKENCELRVNPVKKIVRTQIQETPKILEDLCKGMPLTRAIGLTSLTQTVKGQMHIPMIDFSSERIANVEATLQTIGMPGLLIDSGKSYHFYGFVLLNNDQWEYFMEFIDKLRAVDGKWPSLQLEQGYSLLRLTPSRKKLYQPCFYKIFKPTSTDTEFNSNLRNLRKSSIAA